MPLFGKVLRLGALGSPWFLFAYSQVLLAQELSRTPLRVDKVTPIGGLQRRPILNPIKCDTAGNVYLRFDQPRRYAAPIVKITPNGEHKVAFSLAAAKGWEEGELYDFVAQPGGAMYVLAARRGKDREIERAILSFNEEGGFQSAIPIKATLTSTDQLAVFSTGEFLLAGWVKAQDSSPSTNQGGKDNRPRQPDVGAKTLVLSPAGDLIREVSLWSDFAETETQPGKRLVLPASAISLGASAAGDRGEVYLMFRGAKPEVYVALGKARVVKRIEITAPSKDQVAVSMSYATGVGLVVQFAEKGLGESFNIGASVISVVDPQTGERLYDYQATPEVGGVFACYSPRGLLFLSAEKDGAPILRRSVPR